MEWYFYLNSDNEQAGPVSPKDFHDYGINESTMVWKHGMADWVRAGQIPELSQYFNPVPPPPPAADKKERVSGYGGRNNGRYGNDSVGHDRPAKPDNNMMWAVLSTICCCLPLGIYSIVLSAKVNGLYYNGYYEEAQRMAKEARTWAIVSALVGFIVSVISLVFQMNMSS